MKWISYYPLRAPLIVALIVAATMAFIVSSSGIALKILKNNGPIVHASMDIQYELSLFHLWLEELIQQDPAIDREMVWQHLNQARTDINSMLNGGIGQESNLRTTVDPVLTSRLTEILRQMVLLEELALARLEQSQNNLAGAIQDQAFDKVYANALQIANDVKNTTQQNMASDIAQFESRVYFVRAVVLLIGLLSGVLFYLYERRRNSDYTKLLESKKELGRKQKLLEEAQAMAHIGNWELDPVTMNATWSDEVFRILGIEKIDNVGTELLSTLIHPDDRKATLFSLQCAVTKGHEHHVEYRIIRPDGDIRWLECQAEQLYDDSGNLLKLRGVVQDITQRKVDELHLQQSEERYRTIFEGAPEGVWSIGADLKTIEVNRRLSEIIGYQREEMIGKTPMDFVDDKNLKIFIDQTGKIETTERREYEISLRHKEGHNIPTFFSATTLRSTTGEVLEAVAFITDLRNKKIAEKALRRAQKMDAIGQLTGGIAHDFNNIMAVILGNLSLFERLLTDDEKALQRVNSMKKAGQRAADLTKQLLSFSRRQTTQHAITNINRVIGGMESLITRSLTPEVEVEYQLSDELWLTEIDPGDFEDTLLNLSINARDAMAGRGHLTIESHNATLDAHYCNKNPGSSPGEYVELAVSDSGEGIPKEQQERIFEPFYTTKEPGKGTGLGLSMVFGFVQRSSGFINIYSELGIGTTFRIYLPRAKGEEHSAKEDLEQSKTLPHGKETLLVVDDEIDLLELARELLEELGYKVQTASDGQQALELLDKEPTIDLLFSDVVMPGGMNGYELAEQATSNHPGLKVLLTSGYTGKALTNNAHAQDSTDLLSKPYGQGELAKRIRALLDGVEDQ